jgi:hypothetical protein
MLVFFAPARVIRIAEMNDVLLEVLVPLAFLEDVADGCRDTTRSR